MVRVRTYYENREFKIMARMTLGRNVVCVFRDGEKVEGKVVEVSWLPPYSFLLEREDGFIIVNYTKCKYIKILPQP